VASSILRFRCRYGWASRLAGPLLAGITAAGLGGGLAVVAGAAPAWAAVPSHQGLAQVNVAPAGGWGTAMGVPGLGRLNKGGDAQVVSLSCGSAGNCAAGGFYTDRSHNAQAFVVSEKNGSWGTAIEVPGSAALNKGGYAQVTSLSCGSAGNCAAGGYYYSSSNGDQQAFVVSEKNGLWGTAIEVPGSAALNKGDFAWVVSLSCGSAGNCAAGGFYYRNVDREAFVVSEKNGLWGTAIEVPGSAALNAGGDASTESVSCGPAGSCAVAGYYTGAGASIGKQAFVASEKNGSWGTAIEVPGSAALNKGSDAQVLSLSCGPAGNCAAAGFYTGRSQDGQAFVVSEKNGLWGRAIEVPGSAVLDTGGEGGAESVSCASPGNCAVGGVYARRFGGPFQAFVASEKNGLWGRAIEVPGSAALNAGGNATVDSVSCGSAGNCAAAGYYTDGSGKFQAFVVSEKNGSWGTAIEVPGSGALNTGGYAQTLSVSCAPAGYCAAGGYYMSRSGTGQAFVVSRT
jgi:hypothetical protein